MKSYPFLDCKVLTKDTGFGTGDHKGPHRFYSFLFLSPTQDDSGDLLHRNCMSVATRLKQFFSQIIMSTLYCNLDFNSLKYIETRWVHEIFDVKFAEKYGAQRETRQLLGLAELPKCASHERIQKIGNSKIMKGYHINPWALKRFKRSLKHLWEEGFRKKSPFENSKTDKKFFWWHIS